MCGIVGILRFDGAAVGEADLRPLNDLIAHRGPDDEGYFTDGPVGLAMRRLSVIDLSGGHQPQLSADGRLAIVFNGEIYNYRQLRAELAAAGYPFRTASDTEVVLAGFHRWGTGVFARLEGMWGVGLWDRERRVLTLARDRLGKKQVYLGRSAAGLVFGSEMSVPMRHDALHRRLDLSALGEYLTYSYVTGPRTALSSVTLLPEGHWLTVDAEGRTESAAFWRLLAPPPPSVPATLGGAADAAWAMLVEAVRKRLVADVPVSLMLSSGLDSSAMAHIVGRELGTSMRAFTAGFEDGDFDESVDAGAFARQAGLDWHRVPVDGKVIRDAFPRFIAHAASLQGNTAQMVYWPVCEAIHRDGFKVTLNGSGGDELFAGYKTYQADTVFRAFRHLPPRLRGLLHGAARLLPASLGRVSLDYQMKKFTECPHFGMAKAHAYWRTIFSPAELDGLLVPEARAAMGSFTRPYDAAFAQLGAAEDPALDEILAADLMAWLTPMLPWVDNVSMAHGVELRVPFLDHALVAWALALPADIVFKGWTLKRVMKAMLAGRLPDEVVNRRKAGTHLPISRWLDGPLGDIRDHALAVVRQSGLVVPREVDRLVEEHRGRRRDNTFKIWNLVILGSWLEHFEVVA